MNKEEFAVDEKTYENQDGMIIKIVFSNLGNFILEYQKHVSLEETLKPTSTKVIN